LRRARKSQPESLGPLLHRVLDDLGAGDAALVLRIAERWPEAVGEDVASRCRPTALQGRLLIAEAESSVWCQQLQLRVPEMLAGLRRVFGEEAPAEIRLRVR